MMRIRRKVLFLLLSLCSMTLWADHLPPQSVMRLGAAEHGTGIFETANTLAHIYHQSSVMNREIDSHDHQFGVAMSSAGSIGNLRDLAAGRIEFGFAHANLAELAVATPGRLGLDNTVNRLRLVAELPPSLIQVVARRDLGSGLINNLRGKRVSFGMTDSGQQITAHALFSVHGANPDTMQVFNYPIALGIHKLRQGKLDAIVLIDHAPSMALRDLLVDPDFHLLTFDPQLVDQLISGGLHAELKSTDKNPYDSTDTGFFGVTVATYLLSQDMVPPTSVIPILKYLKSYNDSLPAASSGAAATHQFRLKDFDSRLPVHDACTTLEAENLGTASALVGQPTIMSPTMQSTAEHEH